MELSAKLLSELQRRLKIGNRRGVHLNAIPANSRYKFDLNRLSHIDKDLPQSFVNSLLSEHPLKFKISWKDNVPDLNSLFEEEQTQLVKITKAFENLINQTEAIESEKGINTFGFGFPILARRDKADNKLTVAPVLIWSLRIKRTREFNTWEILRNEDDPIYINEVLINHLQSDSNIEIEKISSEMLDDGFINKDELLEICFNLIKTVNTIVPENLAEIFTQKIENIISIGDKKHYEKLPLNSTNSFIEFGGLFSIFEVQKQNIINDYGNLMELQGIDIALDDLEGHSFQPISSVETDPSQQSILHSLESARNLLIQGPPGTGKSQTLTAVLVNALENNKKTIVVCEKRTALEVLHNALIVKRLHYQSVLIKDIVKDRKTVVDSVRDRIDNAEYRRYRYNFSKENLENIIHKAKDIIFSINAKHKKLDEKLLGTKSWTAIVGDLLKELKNSDEEIALNIEKNIFNFSSQELNSLLEVVGRGQGFYKNYSSIDKKSFLNSNMLLGDNPFIIEQQINEDFDFYEKQVVDIEKLVQISKEEYRLLRSNELQAQIKSALNKVDAIKQKEDEHTSLILSTQNTYFEFRQNELKKQCEDIEYNLIQIETILDKNSENKDLTNESKINSFFFKLIANFSSSKKQIIADYNGLMNNFSELRLKTKKAKDIPANSFEGTLQNKIDIFFKFRKDVNEIKANFNHKIIEEFRNFGLEQILNLPNHQLSLLNKKINNTPDDLSILKNIENQFSSFISMLDSSFENLTKELISNKDLKIRYNLTNSYVENLESLSDLDKKISEVEYEFDLKIENEFESLKLLKLNSKDIKIDHLPSLQEKVISLANKIGENNWLKEKLEYDDLQGFINKITGIIQTKKDYFNSSNDLFTIEFKWFQFYNGLSGNEKLIIDALKDKQNWKQVFLIFYLNTLLINSANMNLPTNDESYKELDETLDGIEKEQLQFIKEFWFSRQIDSTRDFEQNNYGLSVENLYNKRSSHRFKRLSLRQIVQKDADLFTTFFPIILTSPDVASNLFKGMNGYFDIVMFDEASQLRLEDNLPAILKGQQIIIAGDEHQMPPSNYFSKVFDGSVEDEDEIEEEEENQIRINKDDILLSCESLLDFGTELNFQKQHLDFHYRSRHPYLIDFSNYAFYQQRLKPLPNNFEYIPIKYIQVKGTFSEHTNEAEAEMVLSILDKNINRLPNGKYPSIGIATFNIAQRNLIKSKILERQKFPKFADFNAKIQELEENGMFVKNLENIQGDERDVIILSTTYGKGKDGRFTQRFGPINHSKGYKLLNVIVTRAKYKLYCCTSIPEEVFMNYNEYLVTEGSNNKRAVLYAYLAYCKAVSNNDSISRSAILSSLAENTTNSVGVNPLNFRELESPFEEEVYQSLADHFGTDKLIPQLQFAGFRIDIVYDPKLPNKPKIAIECDGAKYHSSREAYLYDRHRQKILERHGFVFHRIWSTNWWRNHKRETERLIEFITKTELSEYLTTKDYSSSALAFTDDVEVLEDYISQGLFRDNETEQDIINNIDNDSQLDID